MRKIIPLIIITLLFITGCSTKNRKSITELKEFKLSTNTPSTTNKYYTVTIPSTVFNALLQNGLYDSVFWGMNIDTINTKTFQKPWYFSTEFINNGNKYAHLKLEGINYYADIWLNYRKIADSSEIKNPFRQYTINISDFLKKGKNNLLLKIYPPKKGDFNVGFVDWNPQAPDNEMGIIRPVKLIYTKEIYIEDYFFSSKIDSAGNAEVKLSCKIKNLANYPVNTKISFQLDSIEVHKKFTLRAKQDTSIVFSADEFNSLFIKNAKLWWPHDIGEPYLYRAEVKAYSWKKISDVRKFKVGIRSIEEYRTDKNFIGVKINGKKVLIKGGGWVDNLFLNNTKKNYLSQLMYIKDMGLNTIRLEGFWGNSDLLYKLCDSLGIMVMAGWSCQWEWENYLGKEVDELYGGIIKLKDIELISQAWKDQIIWLRNHPSVIAWFGASDKLPHPVFENKMFEILNRYDTTRVYINSAKDLTSKISGFSGTKMRGPYEVTAPRYWYEDTTLGGAYGFNSETGPGAQIPVYESIIKFIPKKHLWPIDTVWKFHCGRNEFNSLDKYNDALFNRYWQAKNVREYAYISQIQNYELIRAMFEAFSAKRYKATGIIQWMINSAWPEFYWQLYDYYLVPTGAYFGVKKALAPLHALYDYSNRNIYIVNGTLSEYPRLHLTIEVYDLNSNRVYQSSKIMTIRPNRSKKVTQLPLDISPTEVYFLVLTLTDSTEKMVDRNIYWLSQKQDILEYNNSNWFYTPFKQYADFSDLKKLQRANVEGELIKLNSNDNNSYKIKLENKSDKIAFFISLKLFDESNNIISPVIWSDNFITLLPYETQYITVENLSNVDTVNLKFDYLNK